MDYTLQVPKWIYDSTVQKLLQIKKISDYKAIPWAMISKKRWVWLLNKNDVAPLQTLSQPTHLELDQ